ncbi:hypothetical protein HGRIS_014666 [Hohenbuehelia grisea]|uniref:Uncharacterized protein n=1 Tax=Hohenbuehelia grisea TaxID=104357 RepID=A0ABR3JV33_9AGAR
MPGFIQNEEDEVSRKMIKPKLPDGFDELPEEDQDRETEFLRRRLVHYHYLLSTATHNRVHHRGLVYPFNSFLRRIFIHASAAWEGETIKLLYALMELVAGWENIVTDDTPCPVMFTVEEADAAEKLYQALMDAERVQMSLRAFIGYGDETWVPAAHYETAKDFSRELKLRALQACADDKETTDEEFVRVEANWPFDDMDEKELEEYK